MYAVLRSYRRNYGKTGITVQTVMYGGKSYKIRWVNRSNFEARVKVHGVNLQLSIPLPCRIIYKFTAMSANVSKKNQRVGMHGSGLPMPRDLGVGEHPASGSLQGKGRVVSQTRRSLLSGWRAFALLRKSRSSLSTSKLRSWRQISRGRTAWTCSDVVQTGGGH